jgi:hypothetical protein
VARELADGETEVSVLLPDRKYKGIWHRILHDKTADAIYEEVSRLPHANVTTVPFHLDVEDQPKVSLSVLTGGRRPGGEGREPMLPTPSPVEADLAEGVLPGYLPIIEARWRRRVKIAGRVRSPANFM